VRSAFGGVLGLIVLAHANVAPFVGAALIERWHLQGRFDALTIAVIGAAIAAWARVWANVWAEYSRPCGTTARALRGTRASVVARAWWRAKRAACGLAFVTFGNALCLMIASPMLARLFPV
jgi:hypothetical protein